MLSVAEATRLIAANLDLLPSESVSINKAAGRILRQDIHAERDQPPFNRVTMDGIAVAYDNARKHYRIAGTVFAGDPSTTLASSEHCLEVMTGCVLPEGTDTVIPVEEIAVADGVAEIKAGTTISRGQFIHQLGSDHPARHRLLTSGQRIGMAEMAVLASAGRPTVEVACRPRVAVVSTGNELVAAGEPMLSHQIRLSNSPAIQAGLSLSGLANSTTHHIRDSRESLATELAALLAENDALILSGGVSMGKADFVPGVLAELGVQEIFHRVSQRPGKPFWFGKNASGVPVFALPGNPVSALVGCRRHVAPALNLMMGAIAAEPEFIQLAESMDFAPALTAFIAIKLQSADGKTTAHAVPSNTSGDFASLAGTSGFVELAADQSHWPAGSRVSLYRWALP